MVRFKSGAESKVFKVDLHCHTSDFSACARSSLEEVLEVAFSKLDTLFITEHHVIYPHEQINFVLSKYSGLFGILSVIPAQEVTVYEGGDVLIYGVDFDIPARISLKNLREIVLSYNYDERDVVAIWAHPYRFGAPLVEYVELMDFIDAIEVLNGNCTDYENALAIELAERMGKPMVAGSDAHRAKDVARLYNLSYVPIHNVGDLKLALKSGKIRPCCLERIVNGSKN